MCKTYDFSLPFADTIILRLKSSVCNSHLLLYVVFVLLEQN